MYSVLCLSVDLQLVNEDECWVALAAVPLRHVAVGQRLDLHVTCLYWLELYLVLVDLVLVLGCEVGVCLVEHVGEVLTVI